VGRENLRIISPNVVRIDGYFYHIDSNAAVLFKKTDDGTNAFSYPLDTPVDNPVVSLEHDGRSFWTLENPSGSYDIIIRRWEIEEFVLKHQRKYEFTETASQKYDSSAFAIEHFHLTLSGSASQSQPVINVGVDGNLRSDVGDIVYLGPSTAVGFEGLSEEVTVLATSGTNDEYLVMTSNLVNSYETGDPASFNDRVWFFNQYRPSDPEVDGSGQLFSFVIKDISTTLVAQKAGNEFKDVDAASYLTDLPGTVDARDYLVYMKETSLLFIETQDSDPDFKTIIKSATQNNQRPDNSVIRVYELTHEYNTLFRFQLEATFRIGATDTLEVWGTLPGDPEYNYQLSTLERLPASISLTATPAIISADGVSTATIRAIVHDQFDDPMPSLTVDFTDSDTTGTPAGIMIPTSAVTNAQGIATVNYRAGTVSNLVTITAEV